MFTPAKYEYDGPKLIGYKAMSRVMSHMGSEEWQKWNARHVRKAVRKWLRDPANRERAKRLAAMPLDVF